MAATPASTSQNQPYWNPGLRLVRAYGSERISETDPSYLWMIASPPVQSRRWRDYEALVAQGNHVDGLIWVSAGG